MRNQWFFKDYNFENILEVSKFLLPSSKSLVMVGERLGAGVIAWGAVEFHIESFGHIRSQIEK